jgi:hypothetical protein
MIIMVVCLIFAVYYWGYYLPQSETKVEPSFEIVDFLGREIKRLGTGYRIQFYIRNNGTARATGIHGSLKLGADLKFWRPSNNDTLAPGETTQSYILIIFPQRPELVPATITVECNEGVTQEFTKPLTS